MDWAPARTESLRCGGLKNSRYSLRCSLAQVEVAAQAARRLERQASNLLLGMLALILLDSLLNLTQN